MYVVIKRELSSEWAPGTLLLRHQEASHPTAGPLAYGNDQSEVPGGNLLEEKVGSRMTTVNQLPVNRLDHLVTMHGRFYVYFIIAYRSWYTDIMIC